MCENTDSRCTTTATARGTRLRISGLSRFLLPTFLCGRQRKVGAAPHRGNANRPLTNQGKAKRPKGPTTEQTTTTPSQHPKSRSPTKSAAKAPTCRAGNPSRHNPCCHHNNHKAKDNEHAGLRRRDRPPKTRSPSRADRTTITIAVTKSWRTRHDSRPQPNSRPDRTGCAADRRPTPATHANATSQSAPAASTRTRATLTRSVRRTIVRHSDFMYLLQSRRIFYRQFAVATPTLN